MPIRKLFELLDSKGVVYERLPHSVRYTAQETAQSLHTRGKGFAKVTMLEAAGKPLMAVLPANRVVDVERFRDLLGTGSVALTSEGQFEGLFPDCEPGAEPPFGTLYGIPTWLDEELAGNTWIVFNACTHGEAIRLRYADYARLVSPRVARFSAPPAAEEPWLYAE